MLDDKLPVTLQYQLRSLLLKKIESKEWAPGAQIPSERELCEEYAISRMTVREVLKGLVHEKILVRKQGKGTFVAMPQFEHEFTSSFSLSQEIQREGLHSNFELLSLKLEPAEPTHHEIFGLAAEGQVYAITRLRYIGESIFAWEVSYVPSELLIGVTEEQMQNEGLHMSIYRQSGLMVEEADVESEAVNCPNAIAELLHIKKQQAVFHIVSVEKAEKRVVAYTESYVRSDLYKYKYNKIMRKKTEWRY